AGSLSRRIPTTKPVQKMYSDSGTELRLRDGPDGTAVELWDNPKFPHRKWRRLRIVMQVSIRLRLQSGDQSNRRASDVKLQGVSMSNLTPDQQLMFATWQQHAHAEFVLKDADAALATMTENPHVILIPSGTGGNGWAGVYAFYANQFLPNIPPDFE